MYKRLYFRFSYRLNLASSRGISITSSFRSFGFSSGGDFEKKKFSQELTEEETNESTDVTERSRQQIRRRRVTNDADKGLNPDVTPGRTGETAGITGVFGNRADMAMRGMLGPKGQAEALTSKAVPILGRATAEGTTYTVKRSTIFENWHIQCPDPVGWKISKLGCATCKMANDINEGTESIQLQIIKGCNVFELDGCASDVHQSISRAFYDALQAFELERSGFVFVVRCGVITQPLFQEEITQIEAANTAPVRSRILPIFERFKASSFPSMQLKSGFKISEMSDEQLERFRLRRVSSRSAAGLTPDWLDAMFTNVAYNTKLECIDVLLLEGLHTLFDGRPQSYIDDDILQLFAYLENKAKQGLIQYYGISSPYLAPHIKRNRPPMPADAMTPEQFRNPKPLPSVINLYHIMELAKRAGGESHHLRFIQYPFNLTFSQALSTPLPYDSNHTLVSLSKALGLTSMGTTPLQATDLMDLPQRYHNFPMDADLKSLRMNFFTLSERCVLKELEVKDSIEKGPASLPPMEELFIASVFLAAQRQFVNLFFFSNWAQYYMMPRFRRAVTRFKEASSTDMKEWCKQYEQLTSDMFRLRRRMFEHKHGKRSLEKNAAIDHLSPTLAMCPMINQKAINFATCGCDTVLCGFHVARYFHEATELNPAKNGQLPIPEEELYALCESNEVSFANTSPPDPYMLEPLFEGKLSGQKSKSMEHMIRIDPKNPKFPDIPEELDDPEEEASKEGQPSSTKGTTPKEQEMSSS